MRIYIGFGFSKHARVDEMIALVDHCLRHVGSESTELSALATIDTRKGHPFVEALARAICVDILYFPASRLELETPRLNNPSEELFRKIGCHGVAEAAALAAAGPGSELVLDKLKSGTLTVALARSKGHN